MYLYTHQFEPRQSAMRGAHKYSMSWKLYRRLQRKGWLRCSSILRSRIILRTLSDRTTTHHQSDPLDRRGHCSRERTLIFPDIFQRKGQAGILPLHNADLAKGALSYHAEEPKVIKIN